MHSTWHVRYSFPISFPGEPLQPLDPSFEQSFIRTRIYDELDDYLANIQAQHGKFWISSDYGGCGKSTMLSYIARQLYKNLDTWRALPFHFSVPTKLGTTVQHTFIWNFLEQFSTIDRKLREGARIFGNVRTPELTTIIDGFQTYRPGIEKLKASLASLNEDDLTARFFDVLDKVLSPWKERGIFGKYVLLIDEMDKLKPEDVLRFLSDSQKLFEQIYDVHGFVAFLSGHASWVERIRIGSEFSYYQGKIFRTDPFLNEEDVQKLVQSRLIQCVHMLPSDNPWTLDGCKRLRELTSGIPRRILTLAASVMNEAALKRQAKISAGLVEEVIVREDHLRDIQVYLQANYGTYVKLKEAIDKKVDHVLYIFYNMPYHEVLKTYDRDMGTRTTLLGVELGDNEWANCVNLLTQFDCLEDRGVTRALVKDVAAMFDKFGEHQAMIQKLVPTIVRSLGDIKPKATDLLAPNYEDVIDRIFRRSPESWFTREELHNAFSDAVAIRTYMQIKFPRNTQTAIRSIFEGCFNDYIVTRRDQLMELTDNGIERYRKAPSGLTDKDRLILEIPREDLINRYIDLVVEVKSYDRASITQLDGLIEELLGVAYPSGRSEFKKGALREKGFLQSLTKVNAPKDLRNHMDFYLRESKAQAPTTSLIQELIRQISSSLIEVQLHPTQADSLRTRSADTRGTQRKEGRAKPKARLPEALEETLPDRVPVGHDGLDRILLGGIPKGLAVLLISPSCDERDTIVREFICAGAKREEAAFYVTTKTSGQKALAEKLQTGLTLFVCNLQTEPAIENLTNVLRLNGVENLNDVNIALASAIRKLDGTPETSRRICIEIVSDVLLQHDTTQTRKWLNTLIPELKLKGFTTLAVMDSEIHSLRDVRAVAGVFDGEIYISKKGTKKLLKVEKMGGQRHSKKELFLEEDEAEH